MAYRNKATAPGQLPPLCIGEERHQTSVLKISAPLAKRSRVNVSGSMCASLSARRQRMELLAKASMAKHVNRGTRKTKSCKRSEENTSELQSLMRISYAVFCLKKKKQR